VARCTVERLVRVNGWRGATRTKKVRTTIAEPSAPRPPDLVDRNFRVERPDALYVADFTYVRMVPCFAYTAFVIDAFAGHDRRLGGVDVEGNRVRRAGSESRLHAAVDAR